MIRKSRKPESLAPQAIMKRETTIWRAFWVPEKAKVMIAKTTKFVPPAKSTYYELRMPKELTSYNLPVNLSNFKEKAIEKKKS